ncbi:hypothetical protein [Streptomyces sp. NPDC054794]
MIASADPSLSEGDLVVHRLGWRDYAVAVAAAFRSVDRAAYPSPSLHLGFGLVAYVGLGRGPAAARRHGLRLQCGRGGGKHGRSDRPALRSEPGDRKRRFAKEGRPSDREARLRRSLRLP